jgi:hypothetical protein
MGQRVYASENEERTFCNTCKSPACPSCGHWATVQWQRERWCAIPEGPYRVITFTMPNTLWPLFASSPRLCRKLTEIAARVIVGYARARRGVEVGVMPILHTFNGKLEFNSHVHALVRLSRRPCMYACKGNGREFSLHSRNQTLVRITRLFPRQGMRPFFRRGSNAASSSQRLQTCSGSSHVAVSLSSCALRAAASRSC